MSETANGDNAGKKSALEDLSKEEIIEKYHNALGILKKAKVAKDAITKENNDLKEKIANIEKHKTATDEIIENLTQQKLTLFTSLEEAKQDKKVLEDYFKSCQTEVINLQSKVSELDTVSESYKRQVNRLTDENEQLITHLDTLEKQIDELKNAGIHQQQQLLELEKTNQGLLNKASANDENQTTQFQNQVIELQKMLNISLEEVKNLKNEIENKNEKIEELVMICAEKDHNIKTIANELTKCNESKDEFKKFADKTKQEFEQLKLQFDEVVSNNDINKTDNAKAANELEMTNGKLKEKLTSYHKKMIKFSSDIKDLKNTKNILLQNCKSYTEQVENWKTQLGNISLKLIQDVNTCEKEKQELKKVIDQQCIEIETLKAKITGEDIDLSLYKHLQLSLKEYTLHTKQDIDEFIKSFNNQTVYITDLEEKISGANNKMEEETINLQKLDDGLKGINADYEKLKEQYNLLGKENEAHILKLEQATKEIDDLKNLLNIAENEATTVKSKLEENGHLQIEYDNIKQGEDVLKAELKIKNEHIDKMQNNIQELKTNLEIINNQLKELQDDYNKSNVEVTKLDTENNNLKSEVESLQNKLKNSEDAFNEFEKSNNKSNDDISKLEYENNKLRAEVENLQEKLSISERNYNELEQKSNSVINDFETKNLNLQAEVLDLQKNLNETETFLYADKENLQKLNTIIQEKTIEYEQVQKQFSTNSEEYEKLNLHYKKIMQEHEELQTQYTILKEEINFIENKQSTKDKDAKILEDEIEKYKNENLNFIENINKKDGIIIELEKKTVDLESILNDTNKTIDVLKSTNTDLNNNLQKLNEENRKLKEISDELQISTLEKRVNLLTNENQELLSEMNDMNQALKERGETISRQQVYCDELIKKVQIYEDQFNKQNQELAEKENQMSGLQKTITDLKDKTPVDLENNEVKLKEDIILQLQNEIQILKDKLNSNESCADSSYADSETMSTSTISRTDEMNRLKDLEGPWEERYGKLRSLAIKQKGKIRELTGELTKEQTEKSELQTKYANSVKTIQSMQQQCDKLQDELETTKKESNMYVKKLDGVAMDISKNKQIQANDEETISKLKCEVEALTKEKNSIDEFKKQAGAKFKSFKKVLENNEAEKKQLQSDINKLKSEIEEKEKALKNEIEKHNKTKNSLLESSNECKKQSVLNLEMQDYERSIKDVSQKLEKKQELINKLKGQLESQKSSITSYKDQIKLIEEQMQTGEKEVESYKLESTMLKTKLSELDGILVEKDTKIQTLTENLESARMESEDLATQLTNIAAENQKSLLSLQNEREHLRSQNLGLDQKLREVQDTLKLKEDELNNILSEYQGYKVRAQSVLRQKDTRDIGQEEKLAEESASLRAQVEILNHEIEQLKNTLEKVNSENSILLEENERVNKTLTELSQQLKNCQMELEQLQKKYQDTVNENAETIRNLKVHAETLSTCYRQQVAEQEVRHNREIIELQSKISKTTASPEVPSFMIPSMPREEGEGSESVESSSASIHPIPLERLLSVSSDQESGLLKKQLAENESKVIHLTALLADTEQDLVKHVQMNKVLKEEIRRQQRSVEREQHAENLEYLKNVIFKFITINNGDERSRLVPVLTTILKLSPEEIQKLNEVTKSDKGWSNYLPLWPGAKPQ